MYVRVRQLVPGVKDVVINLTQISKIQDLQNLIYRKSGIPVNKQKLYYKGKELNADHRVVDYKIRLNDVIQLIIQSDDEIESTKEEIRTGIEELVQTESSYYKIGDLIDVLDDDHGAWFEATITDILKSKLVETPIEEKDFIYRVTMENIRNELTAPIDVTFKDIRPRAKYTYSLAELKPGMIVLANYNIDEPKERGYWFQFKIKSVSNRSLNGTLLMGKNQTEINNCTIKFKNEVMKIEEVFLISERDNEPVKHIPLRKIQPYCDLCKDVPSTKCKECSCCICLRKDLRDILIICDECEKSHHLSCLDPPLEKVPEDDWYCPVCKIDKDEIIKAGEKLKVTHSKRKSNHNREDSKKKSTFVWGKGMACVGRASECSVVPKDHYGPIPGIEVGTCWKFRFQLSEAGIHRPPVAGIHGRENEGAYSLILSGGYEDDVDNGIEFYYTGSGGRDLSGNRRVGEQNSDQKLTRMNKALALNCNAPFNDKTGAEAHEWREGKPVRVVRNFKLKKDSKYAPKEGNRYDGIYKVVAYYPEKGQSGFIVWRYLLRRDDPTPPPWSKNGQEFEIIYPPGYLEAHEQENDKKLANKQIKRKHTNSSLDGFVSSKKIRKLSYSISAELEQLISKDSVNEKLWEQCREQGDEDKQKFLCKIQELFTCVCCLLLVHEPVTTECKHNICKECLMKSFSVKIYQCPCCRYDLTKKYKAVVNQNLENVLKSLFPGYASAR